MSSEFDVRKYKNDGQVSATNAFGTNFTLVDGSDALANGLEQVISFRNIRNNEDVKFKAFITAFNETYSPNFNPNEVFGRTDPIYQYKNTTRAITLAFKVPAASESEAFENLGRVQKLIQMLYPNYESVSALSPNALTLSEAPIVRLKVMNLLTSVAGAGGSFDKFRGTIMQGTFEDDFYAAYKSTDDPGEGLLGIINSCTVNHNLEGADGVFQKIDQPALAGGVTSPVKNTILPKLIDVSISFSPMHETTINNANTNLPLFPYGVKLKKDAKAKKREVLQQGTGLNEQRRIKADLEAKRQAATNAQQDIDKQTARFLRTIDKFNNSDPDSKRSERMRNRGARQLKRLDDVQVDSAKAVIETSADLAAAEAKYDDYHF